MRAIDPSNLRNIMVIWLETGFCLLNVPYTNPLDVDSDMLAALLRAIQQVANDGIRKIGWEHHSILFEIKDNLLVVLIMRSASDDEPYRENLLAALRLIIRRFDMHPSWAEQILNGQVKSPRESILDVVQYFPLHIIDETLTPLVAEKGSKIGFDIGEFKLARESLCRYIDGKRTVKQIINDSGMNKSRAIGILSVLCYCNHITLLRVPREDDMLIMTKPTLLCSAVSRLPLEGIEEVLMDFDGTRSVRSIAQSNDLDMSVVLFIAKDLLAKGILSYC